MDTVSVAFCFNDAYCTIAAGAISSLINNSSSEYKYNIYIVHNDITEKNQYLINSLCNKDNVVIKFIEFDLSGEIVGSLHTRKRFSVHVYFRLFLHKILPSLDKILFLDGDIIITSDIANLYNTDISNYSVAAVPEYTVARVSEERLKAYKIPKDSPEDIKCYDNLDNYFRNYLNFSKEELFNYFNAGVLLINLNKAGEKLDKAPKMLEKNYFGQDQDVLNIIFKEDTLLLDQRYNTFCAHIPQFVQEHGRLPDIIHYYTATKPDKTMTRPGDSIYWETIAKTEFYYPLLERFIKEKIDQKPDKINDPKTIENLFYDLKRFGKIHRRRKIIRLLVRVLVNGRKYGKLKRDPGRFFADSKSAFIRFLGRYYN